MAQGLFTNDDGRVGEMCSVHGLTDNPSVMTREPVYVLERVGRSAYRLAFPTQWRIHPVISVDHLEPYTLDP
jgi:hypothetical protein